MFEYHQIVKTDPKFLSEYDRIFKHGEHAEKSIPVVNFGEDEKAMEAKNGTDQISRHT